MTSRKHTHLTVDEIEALALDNSSDRDLLRELVYELGHRSRAKAIKLRAHIEGLLGAAASVTPGGAASEGTLRRRSTALTWDAQAGIVCVDFGTSSMRVGVNEGAGARVLNVGEVCRSTIDDQSIPSAVFVPADPRTVYFGQRAIEEVQVRGDSGTGGVLELSPKKWFVDGSELDAPLSPTQPVTKRQLLVGLLSHSLAAAAEAADWDRGRMGRVELRVAHPVWDSGVAAALREVLDELVHRAVLFVDRASSAVRLSTLQESVPQGDVYRRSKVDAKEPIAAAIDLIGSAGIGRQALVVVDVGAGTIDLAFLASVRPEHNLGTPKLIPLSEPVSLYKAGDVLDAAVIRLLLGRSKHRPSPIERADLLRRRRQVKETLFRVGHASALGARVDLADLEESEEARSMAQDLKTGFLKVVRDAEVWVTTTGSLTASAIDHIDVVFAGGGAGVGFLRRALPTRVTVEGSRSLSVLIAPGRADTTANATEGRLAVARGGVLDAELWPSDVLKAPRSYPGLGAPLHVVRPWT